MAIRYPDRVVLGVLLASSAGPLGPVAYLHPAHEVPLEVGRAWPERRPRGVRLPSSEEVPWVARLAPALGLGPEPEEWGA